MEHARHKKRQKRKKASLKKSFTIDAPPFPSPGKSNVKALKAEKSSKSSQTLFFERVGDGNMCVFWVQKPSGEGGYIHPIDLVVQRNAKEGKEWRQHTNCICPTLSRRENRQFNVPIPARFVSSLKNGEQSYPWRCFFGYKNDAIPHDQCVIYVMNQAVKVITKHSKFVSDCVIDTNKSDKTENKNGPYRSLDSVVIDKGVQTVIYRYFYKEHLIDDNWDDKKNSCIVPETITSAFSDDYSDVAEFFFAPIDGQYSFLAKFFGYNDAPKQSTFNDPARRTRKKRQRRHDPPTRFGTR